MTLATVLGLDKNDAFGIDENAFKTRDEQRLAEQVRIREANNANAAHFKKAETADRVLDEHLDKKALEVVGKKPVMAAPTGMETPSPEASALKAQELKA